MHAPAECAQSRTVAYVDKSDGAVVQRLGGHYVNRRCAFDFKLTGHIGPHQSHSFSTRLHTGFLETLAQQFSLGQLTPPYTEPRGIHAL